MKYKELTYEELYLQELDTNTLSLVIRLWRKDAQVAESVANLIFSLRDADFSISDLEKAIQEKR